LQLGGAGDAYEVSWEEGYEPYGVADLRFLPAYDKRFDAVFPLHDKESFFMDLALGKEPFTFRVFPRGFLLSMAPASSSRPSGAWDRASRASLTLARALTRRKFAELRWAAAAPALAASLWPRGCGCPAHAPGAGPPFICSGGPGVHRMGCSVEAGAALGAAEPAPLHRWELSSETLIQYAVKGLGRLRLDGKHGPAFLKGQASADGLRAERDWLAVRLASDSPEEEPFQVRLDVPPSPWMEFRVRAMLVGGAERWAGRLPGLRVPLPWAKISAAFKWDPGGGGGYWADAEGDGSTCSWTYYGKRPFQLGSAVSQLAQRVELTDGGRRCILTASVNGLRVFHATAEHLEPPDGVQEAATETSSAYSDVATVSPDLCLFLKDDFEGSPPQAEAWLSSIVISAGIKA